MAQENVMEWVALAVSGSSVPLICAAAKCQYMAIYGNNAIKSISEYPPRSEAKQPQMSR